MTDLTMLRACDAARATGVNVNTIRSWALRGLLAPCDHDRKGRPLYRPGDVTLVAQAIAARQAERDDELARRIAHPRPARLRPERERQELVGYNAVHQRLKRDQGPASAFSCATCGWPAQDWAYDHGDAAELDGSDGPYSLDPSHYRPLCRPCHKSLDLRIAA